MRTRNVYIANLPPLLQDMVREQFVDDCSVNVQVSSTLAMERLVEKDHLDLVMLPAIYKTKHISSVYALLRAHPCARVLFIGQEQQSNEIMELQIECRQVSDINRDSLRDLFYNPPELCANSLSPWELN